MLLYNKEIGSTWIGIQNISSVVEFQRWWVLKSKINIFLLRSNIALEIATDRD